MLFAALILVLWLAVIILMRLGESPLENQRNRVYINSTVSAICLIIMVIWAVAAMTQGQYPADDSVLWLGVVGLVTLPFAIMSGRTLKKMSVDTV